MFTEAPRALVAVLLLATACTVDAGSTTGGPPPVTAPAAPNEGAVTAEVLEAAVIDSSTVGIAPSQPLCVLTMRLLTVSAVSEAPNTVNAGAGQTIRAYSKDVSLAGLKGRTVSGRLRFAGDERGGHFWFRR